MWWAGFSTRRSVVDVYFSTNRVFFEGNDAQGHQLELVAQDSGRAASGVDEALQLLKEKVRHSGSQSYRLWVSGGLQRPFLIDAPVSASPVELQKIGEALAPEKVGFDESCAVWVQERPVAGAALAVAMPSRHLQSLLGCFSRGNGQRLLSMRPWWSEGLRIAVRGDGVRLVAVQDSDSLTLLTGGNGAFDSAQTVGPDADQLGADALIARKSLAMDIDDDAIWRMALRDVLIDRQRTEAASELADIAFSSHTERSQ